MNGSSPETVDIAARLRHMARLLGFDLPALLNEAADEIERLRGHAQGPGWECMGRKQTLPEPGECNWPDCGCDPHATKVIESLIEQGWAAPAKATPPMPFHEETMAGLDALTIRAPVTSTHSEGTDEPRGDQ